MVFFRSLLQQVADVLVAYAMAGPGPPESVLESGRKWSVGMCMGRCILGVYSEVVVEDGSGGRAAADRSWVGAGVVEESKSGGPNGALSVFFWLTGGCTRRSGDMEFTY